jgi:hypothetical protein
MRDQPNIEEVVEPQEAAPGLVLVRHRLTGGKIDKLFVQIIDYLTDHVLAEYPSPRWAQVWLNAHGYSLLPQVKGVWAR